jgi:anti-sigma regulatory factor (Ser/Thr protein kinase)
MTVPIDSARDCKLFYTNPVQGESAIILLRSKLLAISQRLGFPDIQRENMALVMAEMVTNQIKHAGGRGMIQLWQQPGPVLDIFALDFGPGIANLSQAQEDGFSSANTLGKGLGSILRLSDEAHVYTQAEAPGLGSRWNGCAFLARFRRHGKRPEPSRSTARHPEIGLYSRSLADERYNGDRVYLRLDGEALRWLHLDGLGHGEHAQKSTANLARHLDDDHTPMEVLERVDRQLMASRGAVGLAGKIAFAERSLTLAGVGDMHAHLFADDELQNVAFPPGVLGREHKRPVTTTIGFDKRIVAITASDGIRRNGDFSKFSALFHHHPQLIAYLLGNIMGRISDDQSLCVASYG